MIYAFGRPPYIQERFHSIIVQLYNVDGSLRSANQEKCKSIDKWKA